MDLIGAWAPTLGPVGLLATAVLAVLTGRLWPRRTVLMVLNAMREREQLAERRATEYRVAYLSERERADLLARHLAEAMEVGRTGARAMQALQDMAFTDQNPPTQQQPQYSQARGVATVYDPRRPW